MFDEFEAINREDRIKRIEEAIQKIESKLEKIMKNFDNLGNLKL